ncbi:type II secretion system F family protein [Mycetocola sp. 2940]|uniref:type II secretion system F family protein n=1 Tax=Mycetocola sp. 2940 TaxID=3156452 RepID=UPI00339A9603
MNEILFVAGAVASLLAILTVVFVVIAPPAPRIPVERRRAPGDIQASGLTRLTDRTVGAIDGAIVRRGRAPFSAEQLEQASIRMKPSAFLIMVIAAGLVLAIVGLVATIGTLWMFPAMIIFAALAPLGATIMLNIRASKRRARFADQLDESLTLLAGGLRAGHSLLRAVDAASQETESPTSEEFARVVNETRIGRDLGDALSNTATRMRSEDFEWVAQAIAINREVGGNLSLVLDQVSHTIRQRNQIRRQVKGLAAEGKMSAWILILLPIVVFLFILLLQPSYLDAFFGNILGILALIVAVILLIVGSFWMMAVVKVKF